MAYRACEPSLFEMAAIAQALFLAGATGVVLRACGAFDPGEPKDRTR
jgi:hypothetical protein